MASIYWLISLCPKCWAENLKSSKVPNLNESVEARDVQIDALFQILIQTRINHTIIKKRIEFMHFNTCILPIEVEELTTKCHLQIFYGFNSTIWI